MYSLAEASPRTITYPKEGGMVLQRPPELYAVFFSSEHGEQFNCLETNQFTYARVIANGFKLSRVGSGQLIPQASKIDEHYRNNILAMSTDDVDEYVLTYGMSNRNRGLPSSKLPAERLYQAVGGRSINGVTVEVCATYGADGELIIIDESGGYAVGTPGLEPRAGIARDRDLFAGNAAILRPQIEQLAPVSAT